ncbi:UNVERIFIED_CONTAM: Retrovirus-related Pol polyprotein from transposon RE2 [Sesamum radiatum]|uniref:Retrovirus-related Pol polyprotein from transposon RE2 n=1 Tax=Sesamum radiatum TaxID=300843 RepID=A0AAW2K888_SESRA
MDDQAISAFIKNEMKKILDKPAEEDPFEEFNNYADGSKQCVETIGSILLSNVLQLDDVLLVPSLKFNLLSDHRTNKIVAVGQLVGKLYILDEHSFETQTIRHFTEQLQEIGLVVSSTDVNLWHRRLGHTSTLVLNHLDFLKDVKTSLNICEVCPLAKQHRLDFPVSSTKTSNIFDLVHMDIWGPYNQHSLSQCTYMLTLVDDYSRSTWTFLMKYKSQTLSVLKEFHKMVLTQFEKRIKSLRSDNGTEFINQDYQNFMKNEGNIHQKTCVYTPQQNGVVERKHKYLLQIARALMFQSNVPNSFWSEALLTATYILNRLPTKILNGKSPYEILYKRTPAYEHLRVFGSLCFATNT